MVFPVPAMSHLVAIQSSVLSDGSYKTDNNMHIIAFIPALVLVCSISAAEALPPQAFLTSIPIPCYPLLSLRMQAQWLTINLNQPCLLPLQSTDSFSRFCQDCFLLHYTQLVFSKAFPQPSLGVPLQFWVSIHLFIYLTNTQSSWISRFLETREGSLLCVISVLVSVFTNCCCDKIN